VRAGEKAAFHCLQTRSQKCAKFAVHFVADADADAERNPADLIVPPSAGKRGGQGGGPGAEEDFFL
jgi:hypothetical protein